MGKPARSGRTRSRPGENRGESLGVSTTLSFLTGQWITSYHGWMHVMPKPEFGNPPQPPQIAGYDYFPPRPKGAVLTKEFYVQREGYFVFAALMCLRFSNGGLKGILDINRGGRGFLRNSLTGTYTLELNSALNVYEGGFTTIHKNKGNIIVENGYSFIMKSNDEIEWVWESGIHRVKTEFEWKLIPEPYRALVTHGTLRRIQIP